MDCQKPPVSRLIGMASNTSLPSGNRKNYRQFTNGGNKWLKPC